MRLLPEGQGAWLPALSPRRETLSSGRCSMPCSSAVGRRGRARKTGLKGWYVVRSETTDIAGLRAAICTVAWPSSAVIATRSLARHGIWVASPQPPGILGLCLHHVGRPPPVAATFYRPIRHQQMVVCRGGRRADPLRTGRKHSGRAGNLALQRQVPGQFLGDFGAI